MAVFSKDPVEGLLEYVDEVKPFHTKVLDVVVEYTYTDEVPVQVSERLEITVEPGFTDTANITVTESLAFSMDVLELSEEVNIQVCDIDSNIIWDGEGWDGCGWNTQVDPFIDIN